MSTGSLRLDFQIAAVAHTSGIVLNVGANCDPADLRYRFGTRVINSDLTAYDEVMRRPNVVDRLFDMMQPWPFDDDYAELAVIGDVLGDLPFDQIVTVLKEARRTAREVCVTVPERNGDTSAVGEEMLREVFRVVGLVPYIFVEGDWDSVHPLTTGHCAMCYRSEAARSDRHGH